MGTDCMLETEPCEPESDPCMMETEPYMMETDPCIMESDPLTYARLWLMLPPIGSVFSSIE